MPDCLLIADDLTGACDAAVHFAMRGRCTVACVAYACEPLPDVPVLALSTDSRALPSADLRQLMSDAARRLPVESARFLFKKIDSTMRGNIGAEIAAAVEAFECDAAVITPAFPNLKRVVEAGYLMIRGAGSFAPIEVARRLRWQGAEPCLHIRPCAVGGVIDSGARFISVDACCNEDLDRIVAEALDSKRRLLWAGSGGLASALARTLAPSGHELPPVEFRAGPVVFCLGSDHPVTLAQQEELAAARPEHPVLRIPRTGLAEEVVRDLIGKASPAALVLSGGDTASLVCRAIGARTVELHGEIVPGIPLGVLKGGIYNDWPVATKAGGFGDADALIRVADFLSCRNL